MMQVLLKMSDVKSQKGGKSEARFKSHHLKNSLKNSSRICTKCSGENH